MNGTLVSSSPIKLTDAPMRRMNRNDKALLQTSEWNGKADFKLEDKVSLPHKKAAFLQGVVVYVGEVHFAEGLWIGVQLTGPSIGKGDCDGVYKGKKYFANVGRNNGVLAPVNKVNKRHGNRTGDPKIDKMQRMRRTRDACMADLDFIDCLVQERAMAMLKLNEEKKNRFGIFSNEEAHITRLKQLRLEEVMKSRGALPDKEKTSAGPPSLKYSTPGSELCAPDMELVDGLEATQQNYCLSDPCMPDNPIVFVSQAFLNMTGYHMNEILGKNCRFLQGENTNQHHVNRIRLAIQEGSDCHVCLANYRKNGKKFYNRLFMTALRDTRGRVKNYLGVQCEVSAEVARRINNEEAAKTEAKLKSARISSTLELSSRDSVSHNSFSHAIDVDQDDFDVSSNTELFTPQPLKKPSCQSSREIPIIPYAADCTVDSEDEDPVPWPKKTNPPRRPPASPKKAGSRGPTKPKPRRRSLVDNDKTPPPRTPQRMSCTNDGSRSSRSSRDSDYTPPARHPKGTVPISEIEAFLGQQPEWCDDFSARLSL